MTTHEAEAAPPAKRRRIGATTANVPTTTDTEISKSLDRPISPPLSRRKSPNPASLITPAWDFEGVPKHHPAQPLLTVESNANNHGQHGLERSEKENDERCIRSPIQLTRIKDLGPHQNIDTVELKDILGDPLIKECWNFNFLFDLDFVMQHFDSDVRHLVKVKIVHGFWKRDDERRIALLEVAERYPNIELLSAYIPDPFGTHHSKMLILFRHDDTAQVLIHTANMIYRDWNNMTQAVWISPRLPIIISQGPTQKLSLDGSDTNEYPLGSGRRFQVDLLRYLAAYERRLSGLTKQLEGHDFTSIKAAFIGSAPSRQKTIASDASKYTAFGWLGLKEILSHIPIARSQSVDLSPHIVTQISSIATLGPTPAWFTHFQTVLAWHSTNHSSNAEESIPASTTASTFFAKRVPSKQTPSPKFSIIFPTAEEIRTSLDGYAAGGSIHWKLQSSQQQKQLDYLRPMLCYWKPAAPSSDKQSSRGCEAHRGAAAPHIKTYIRFATEEHKTIDWAMVTSANLSKQAWGDVVNRKGEIWIQSWEAGVVVWPALFAESTKVSNADVVMVPTFGIDMPYPGTQYEEKEVEDRFTGGCKPRTIVGFRMPYDLPLRSYGPNEKPWCATMKYQEPDSKGQAWGGY